MEKAAHAVRIYVIYREHSGFWLILYKWLKQQLKDCAVAERNISSKYCENNPDITAV